MIQYVTMAQHKNPIAVYIVHAVIACFVAIVTVVVQVSIEFWQSLPDIHSIETLLSEESIIITDREEGELYRLFSNKDRFSIDVSTLPEYVRAAFIAIEDKRFYERNCVDFTAIARAMVANLQKSKSQGASTITQQLVRSIYLSNQKTYERKIREIALACNFEWNFSKNEILSMYINSAPFGGTNYGIEQASGRYFNKHANELSLAEAAILAAIPQRPTYYYPYGNNVRSTVDRMGLLPALAPNGSAEVLQSRTQLVLEAMQENGYITETEKYAAIEELLTLQFSAVHYSINAPHFVFWLRNQLNSLSQTQNVDGLIVKSTIHSGVQQLAEDVVERHSDELLKKYNIHNIALLSIDRQTNEILAYVGNTNYFDEVHGQNDLVQTPRQPGSSFKPVVYASAFMAGIDPESFVQDEPITLGNYSPKNYEGGFFGRMTIGQALCRSRNIPAIKAFFWAGGEEAVLNTAKLLGIHTPSEQKKILKEKNSSFTYGWPLALGSAEVTLLELVQAYSVFAHQGTYIPISGIRYITTSQNETIFTSASHNKPRKAIDESIANAIDAILHNENDRPEGFWRNQLTLPGGSTVKTGTSSKCITEKNGYCTSITANNNWVIGYNNELITGVWLGNADGSGLANNADGITAASPIWRDFMIEASVFMQK